MTEADATVTATAPPGGTATATASEPVSMQKIVEHGEPSSLPELVWGYRRLFVFALTTAACAFVWFRTKNADAETLRMCLRYALWIIGLLVFVYVTGGSAEKVVQLITAFRSTRREVTTTAPPAALPPTPPAPPRPGEVLIPKSIP